MRAALSTDLGVRAVSVNCWVSQANIAQTGQSGGGWKLHNQRLLTVEVLRGAASICLLAGRFA